ncbi:MAG TPA: sulfite exporter TauE/SafE family protein [Reyranellaceae bacterium]|nr:sulfite exporter TauE/SafE family protein [Reyranellaceae bacterium]
MEILPLALFAVAAFAAAFVAGLAGFAFGLVAMAIWLHLLTPTQVAILITGYALIVQGQAVWKLRRAIRPRRLLPFVLGGLLGVPLGVELLRVVPAEPMRVGIGIFLIVFSLYSLLRPALPQLKGERPLADGGIGVLSGVIGGSTGLATILPTIWSTLRGWPKDEQRAVFQPVGVALFVVVALWLGGTGTVDRASLELFLIGLPFVLVGTWLGLKLYGRLDEAGFRRVVLIVLLISGVALVF